MQGYGGENRSGSLPVGVSSYSNFVRPNLTP